MRSPPARPPPAVTEPPLFVCLVGIDACGKTTQAQRLAAWSDQRGQLGPSRVCGVWDVLSDPDLNSTGWIGDPTHLRDYLVQLHPDSRSLFLFHALFESYVRAIRSGDRVLFLSGYWYKYWVTECLLGAHEPLLEPIVRLFEEPDVTLFLDLDPAEAATRREAFSRYECGGEDPSPEAFVAFQERCRAKLLGLQGPREWVHIDAHGSEDEVFERITTYLAEEDGRL